MPFPDGLCTDPGGRPANSNSLVARVPSTFEVIFLQCNGPSYWATLLFQHKKNACDVNREGKG